MRFISFLILACGAFACADGAGPSDELQVDAIPPRLILANESSATVYVVVIERNSLAVVDWIPCIDPVMCPGIQPGADSIIRYDRITGYDSGEDEAVVYWWHLVPRSGGGYQPDEIRQVIVEL